jgi:hypothetical protein
VNYKGFGVWGGKPLHAVMHDMALSSSSLKEGKDECRSIACGGLSSKVLEEQSRCIVEWDSD